MTAPDWAALERDVLNGPHGGQKCRLCSLLGDLPTEGRETVERLLALPTEKAPHRRIADCLTAMGYRIHRNTVENHRKQHMGGAA